MQGMLCLYTSSG